jgi:hypothetical protein
MTRPTDSLGQRETKHSLPAIKDFDYMFKAFHDEKKNHPIKPVTCDGCGKKSLYGLMPDGEGGLILLCKNCNPEYIEELLR